jgi:hypothetical protein
VKDFGRLWNSRAVGFDLALQRWIVDFEPETAMFVSVE